MNRAVGDRRTRWRQASATAITSRPIWLPIHAYNNLLRRPHLNQLQQRLLLMLLGATRQTANGRWTGPIVTSRVTSPAWEQDGCCRPTICTTVRTRTKLQFRNHESWYIKYALAGDNTSKTQTTTNEKPWIKSSASKFVFPKNILPLLLVLFIANMRVDIRLVVIFIQSNDFNDFTVDKWYRLHHHISVISVLLFHSSM